MLSILITILVGAFIGWVASLIMKTDEQQGAIANILIGILGAAIGGFLFRLIFGAEETTFIGELIVGILGAMLVIYIWQKFSGKKPAQTK